MTPLSVALGALSLLTLLALMLAVTAVCHARMLARVLASRSDSASAEVEPILQGLRGEIEGLAAQLHALQEQPSATWIAAPPRAGLNLVKRSQALRLHRHGNPAPEIAAALELPVQEVELLLKVHRIVIGSL